MIVKGNARPRNPRTFADYLERSDEQSRVAAIILRGVAALDLRGAIEEMDAVARGAICKAPLYHAMISPTPGLSRTMMTTDWLHAAEVVEDALGLSGQPRAVVIHESTCVQDNVVRPRSHAHIVLLRVCSQTMRSVPLKFDLRALKEAAAKLARQFGYEPVVPDPDHGPWITPAEEAIAKRGGFTIRQFRAQVSSHFEGKAGQATLPMGVRLARGDRGVPVFVTNKGGVLSVRRSAHRVSLADLEAGIGDINRLPTVAQAKAEQQAECEWRTLMIETNRQEAETERARKHAAAREQMALARAEILGAASITGKQVDRPLRFMEARMAVNTAINGGDARPETVQFMWDPHLGVADPLWLHPVANLVERLADVGVLCTVDKAANRLVIATCDCTDIALALYKGWSGFANKSVGTRYILDALEASVADSTPETLFSGVFRPCPYTREDGWGQDQLETELRLLGILGGRNPGGVVTWLAVPRKIATGNQATPLEQLMKVLGQEVRSTVIEPVEASSIIIRASASEIIDRISWLRAIAPSKARAWLDMLRAGAAQSAANEAARNAIRMRKNTSAYAQISEVKIISSKVITPMFDPDIAIRHFRQAAAIGNNTQQLPFSAISTASNAPNSFAASMRTPAEKPMVHDVQERRPTAVLPGNVARLTSTPNAVRRPLTMPNQPNTKNENSEAQFGQTLPLSAQRSAAVLGVPAMPSPAEAKPAVKTPARNAPAEASPVLAPAPLASTTSIPQPKPPQPAAAKTVQPGRLAPPATPPSRDQKTEPTSNPQTITPASITPDELEAEAKREKRRRAVLAERRRNRGGFEL